MADHVFEWDWCCMCGAVVRCPKCGNNSCNGAFGELEDGSKCDVCPQAYEIQDKAYADGTVPVFGPEKKKHCPDELAAQFGRSVDELPQSWVADAFDGPPAILDFGGGESSFPLDENGAPM